jgi:hypothetical protein
LLATLGVAGCASNNLATGHTAIPASTAARHGSAPSPDSPPSCRASGFAISLAQGYHGWASPVEAARQFARQSDPGGNGTASTVWTVTGTDGSGATLASGVATLHAARLPNGRWAIDSGQRCD